MDERPVLTIFAGPNGSGKSTLQRKIANSGYDLGVFINADEIAVELAAQAEVTGFSADRQALEIQAFHEAERRRRDALAVDSDFSFETVFSHPSKLGFIEAAKARGFFVRLFFVSTEDARLNIARVQKRVAEGGHDVPLDKISARYARTMSHLAPACKLVDEAFLFDNSTSEMRLRASFAVGPAGEPVFRFVPPLPAWIEKWAAEMNAPAR